MFSLTKRNVWNAVNQTSSIISSVFQRPTIQPLLSITAVRFASNFSPRRTKYKKAQKGKIPIPIGGSTKGTTVEFGDYGLRVKEGCRLTSRQLTAVHNTLRRKIKPIKGSQLWMRVFPDIPVTSKGNEVRMGKGKGTFEYWACRVPLNRVVFEIGGMRKEIAKEAFRLVSNKLPVKTEMIDRKTKPIVGAHGLPPVKPVETATKPVEAVSTEAQN